MSFASEWPTSDSRKFFLLMDLKIQYQKSSTFMHKMVHTYQSTVGMALSLMKKIYNHKRTIKKRMSPPISLSLLPDHVCSRDMPQNASYCQVIF